MSLVGPVIRAAEGEVIEVTLHNNLEFSINIEPSGVMYNKPVTLNPGETGVYIWVVPDSIQELKDEASSQLWVYRSSVDTVAQVSAGLAGPLILRKKDAEKDYDREFVVILQVA